MTIAITTPSQVSKNAPPYGYSEHLPRRMAPPAILPDQAKWTAMDPKTPQAANTAPTYPAAGVEVL